MPNHRKWSERRGEDRFAQCALIPDHHVRLWRKADVPACHLSPIAPGAEFGCWLPCISPKILGDQWVHDCVLVTGPDILARTVFYNVGHHGSQNATLKTKGLELMINKDLSAFIPTNKKDALNARWGEMPFGPILDDLEKRTTSRVIRADDPWIKDTTKEIPIKAPSGSIQGLRRSQTLWVELDLG